MAQMSVEGTLKAIVDAEWGVLSSGAIEAPTGRFTVVEIPAHVGERAEMREAVFADEEGAATFDSMEAGWYFVIRSDSGVEYDLCKNKSYAMARFALARSAYEDWEDEQLGLNTRDPEG